MSTENAKQIERLFRNWPQSNLSDEAMQAYGEAIHGKHRDDVFIAVDRLVKAKISRDHAFIPNPVELNAQIERAMIGRLDNEARARARVASPEPKRDITPEERKATVQRLRDKGLLKMHGMGNDYISPADHEAAKAKAIKEALSLETDKLIITAANGDDAALAEYQRNRPVVNLSDESLVAFGISRKEREMP